MRKYVTLLALLVLFGLWAVAQESPSSGQSSNPASSTTQTTTTQTTTTTGQAASNQADVEGCIVKEQSDYFLVPKSGSPIQLQASAGENLSEHEGHRVKVSGNQSPISGASSASAGASGGMSGTTANAQGSSSGSSNPSNQSSSGAIGSQTGSQSSSSGMAMGGGSDLHKLATEQISVTKVQHVAASCPADWNPNVKVPSNSGSSKY